MPNTLLLDTQLWDLCKDASGNIAMASEPYAIAQDVASAIKLFLGELWYDTTKGIPYFENILGQQPNTGYIKAQIEKAALTVPNVTSARCLSLAFSNGVYTGVCQVIDVTGAANNVKF
ncbi:MAG: hypothetical protein KGI54_14945 [Pseudomonadota bacterium]|nr:hypothetical protein [Pseudomonadota bacterium]